MSLVVPGLCGAGGSMTTARFGRAWVRMQDGRIMVPGGFNVTDGILSSVEVWSPVR